MALLRAEGFFFFLFSTLCTFPTDSNTVYCLEEWRGCRVFGTLPPPQAQLCLSTRLVVVVAAGWPVVAAVEQY